MSKKLRAFIVDDDEDALASLKQLLDLSDFEVEATKNPKESIAKIKSFKPDIVLLDLLMPVLGGLEICEMLNDDKTVQGIPIIIISALGGYSNVSQAFRLGVVGYITKPYDFEQLLQEIKKAVTAKQDT